jgi:hypothetical protein
MERTLNKYYVESQSKQEAKEKEKEESQSHCPCYGFHTGVLLGGDLIDPGGREVRPLLRGVKLLKGVAGRRKLSSPSTRLRN